MCVQRTGCGTLRIGEPQAASSELLAQHAVLLLEIVDDVALLLVDPPGDGDNKELQGLWKRTHTGRAYQRRVAALNAAF